MNEFATLAERHRWLWAACGIILLWAVLGVVSERFSLQNLTGVMTSAAFLAFPALGQMFVVTTGRGNIDLSLAGVITLSAYVMVTLGQGSGAQAGMGFTLVLLIGGLTGVLNAALVVYARIPAMIATLATGYILATAALIANRGVRGRGSSEILSYLAIGKVGSVPVIALLAAGITAIAAYILTWTAYGRHIAAVGQNSRAAALAGVQVGRTVFLAFIASSLLAAIGGALLSAYVGGAFLEMGSPYLLQSVGAVVLGGTLIAGGHSTALGTLLGSVLLVLIITTLQIAGLPPGSQDIVQGAVIISVLAFAGPGLIVRRAHKAAAA